MASRNGQQQVGVQQQVQTQTLSPQQILLVKLLELPAVEMEEKVRAELLDNPALEEGEDKHTNDSEDIAADNDTEHQEEAIDYDSKDDYLTEDDIPDYKLQEHNYSRQEQAEEIPFSDSTSFYETLKDQLNEHDLSERQKDIGTYLIGSIDDDGLLRKSLTSIVEELALYADVETNVEELKAVLHVIQSFDPAGIGAQTLQECLLIQLARKRKQQPDNAENKRLFDLEEAIIKKCYDEFTSKRWHRIQQRLNITETECEQAIKEITKLNPRPGASMGETVGKNMQQIVPDFIVDVDEYENITLTLNDRDIPELRLSPDYNQMLIEQSKNKQGTPKQQKEALLFLRQKIDAAQNFISAVKQRQETMMTTMQAIIDIQRPFFIEGEESLLKPMILKDVAQRTGLDISTVSRVCSSKYVQTNYGIFSLKFFFSDSFTSKSGEDISIRQMKQVVKDTIDNEDHNHPYTDIELADLLQKKGYDVARRTITKYRIQLNIPVARLRKK